MRSCHVFWTSLNLLLLLRQGVLGSEKASFSGVTGTWSLRLISFSRDGSGSSSWPLLLLLKLILQCSLSSSPESSPNSISKGSFHWWQYFCSLDPSTFTDTAGAGMIALGLRDCSTFNCVLSSVSIWHEPACSAKLGDLRSGWWGDETLLTLSLWLEEGLVSVQVSLSAFVFLLWMLGDGKQQSGVKSGVSMLSSVVLDFGETLCKCGWLGGALGFCWHESP